MTCRSTCGLPAGLFVALRHGDFDQLARIQHAQHDLLTVTELDWLSWSHHAATARVFASGQDRGLGRWAGVQTGNPRASRTAKGAFAGNDGLSASRAVAEFSFVDRYFVAGLNDPARIFDNLLHEAFGRGLASFDPVEFRLPFTGEFGRLEVVVPHERHEVATEVCRHEVLLLAHDVLSFQQRFDDRGTCRRRAQPFLLESFA